MASLSLGIKIKILIAFAIALSGCFAHAQEVVKEIAEPAKNQTCVFKDLVSSEVCPAFATARALEILGVGDETVIFVEKDAAEKIAQKKTADRTSIVASSRIEDAVRTERLDSDDAMLLEREVQELSGARYELPTSRREITKTLGFPENAEIAPDDWIEMLRVHAEMTLSLSAQASRFLLEQMGLVAAAPPPPVAAVSPTPAPTAESSDPVVVETHRDTIAP